MFKLTTAFITLGLLLASVTAHPHAAPEPSSLTKRQFDGKQRLFVNGLGVMDAHYAATVTNTHNGVKTYWPLGTAPQWCRDVSNEARDADNGDFRPRCELSKLRVFNVQYDDCSLPWQMCRCSDAQITDDEMVREFGRLPARMKQQIRHVIGFDASDVNGNIPSGCGGAFNGGDNMAFFGDCDGPSVWMHEAAHSLDQYVSEGQYFRSQVAADSCIPDGYAGSSYAEDFAQLTVVLMNKLNAPPIPYDTSCMQNQLNVVSNAYRTNVEIPGATCDLSVRRTNDPPVSIPNNVKRSEAPEVVVGENIVEDFSSGIFN